MKNDFAFTREIQMVLSILSCDSKWLAPESILGAQAQHKIIVQVTSTSPHYVYNSLVNLNPFQNKECRGSVL